MGDRSPLFQAGVLSPGKPVECKETGGGGVKACQNQENAPVLYTPPRQLRVQPSLSLSPLSLSAQQQRALFYFTSLQLRSMAFTEPDALNPTSNAPRVFISSSVKDQENTSAFSAILDAFELFGIVIAPD